MQTTQTAKNKAQSILNRHDADNDLKPAECWQTAQLANALIILAERIEVLEERIAELDAKENVEFMTALYKID